MAGDGTFIFTKPDGTIVHNCPRLPETHGDICSQHHADVAACFANARVAGERRQAQEQELATVLE